MTVKLLQQPSFLCWISTNGLLLATLKALYAEKHILYFIRVCEMGETCRRKLEIHTLQCQRIILIRRHNLREVGIDGSIILKWTLTIWLYSKLEASWRQRTDCRFSFFCRQMLARYLKWITTTFTFFPPIRNLQPSYHSTLYNLSNRTNIVK